MAKKYGKILTFYITYMYAMWAEIKSLSPPLFLADDSR